MEYPKFTVVTPTYNQGQFIEKTIDSVLSQGYPNLEFIIIDGGSKDNTVEVIKKYEHHLAYWVSEPDRGQSHAINKGMGRATGDYLTWLNSDDWYLPGALHRMHELFAAHPEIGMVVGAGRIVDQMGKEVHYISPTQEITLESLYKWLSSGNFLQPSSAFTRSAWESAGHIDEQIHIALDLDLWLRMAKAGVKFVTTDALLSEALSHPQAKTTAFEDLMRLDCALVIIRHGGEHVVRKTLEVMITRYTWYRRNYETIVSNPLLKMLRPIVKRFSKPGEYWNDLVPPWVKD
ncbi:MAG: glycosyltransferase [Betaproteobacteria bacterium]|nr:glycosyltransferase [Betaproteobacteria bacterium]